MGKRYKFTDLNSYFESQEYNEIQLTFNEMEAIIGEKLSDSAYNYRAYWSPSPTHTLPNCWLENGYKLTNLDMKEKKAVFTKTDSERTELEEIKKRPNIESVVNNFRKKQPTIEIGKVIDGVKRYYSDTTASQNSRYLSWEHCHRVFLEARNKPFLVEEDIDYLSLHLAFYLASWGMLRGSSFLLQKDYKVHTDTIKELYKPCYINLWKLKCSELQNIQNIDALFELIKNMQKIYDEKRRGIKEVDTDISDILTTKVLLGTMGCIPAYDEYFKKGIGKYKIATQKLGKSSVRDLIEYYADYEEEFEIIRKRISEDRNTNYPQMKILDMAFWQLGFDNK